MTSDFLRSCRRFLVEYTSLGATSERVLMAHSMMNGLTGPATAEAIMNCVGLMDKNKYCYLEIGIYQGCNLSLVASSNPEVECFGVDNFSQKFQEDELTTLTTEQCCQNKIDFFRLNKTKVIKDDFRNFLSSKRLDKQVGVYFFDGPHEFEDQVDGIEMALPYLADEAIVFIDDLRSENVQKSYSFLVEKYKELTPICFTTLPQYDQGQVVLEFKRRQ